MNDSPYLFHRLFGQGGGQDPAGGGMPSYDPQVIPLNPDGTPRAAGGSMFGQGGQFDMSFGSPMSSALMGLGGGLMRASQPSSIPTNGIDAAMSGINGAMSGLAAQRQEKQDEKVNGLLTKLLEQQLGMAGGEPAEPAAGAPESAPTGREAMNSPPILPGNPMPPAALQGGPGGVPGAMPGAMPPPMPRPMGGLLGQAMPPPQLRPPYAPMHGMPPAGPMGSVPMRGMPPAGRMGMVPDRSRLIYGT